MGIIIMVVAVLDNHIERNPVAIMNPNTRREGFPPISFSMRNAMRLCRFHCSTAIAIRKPPRNRKISQLMYSFATSSVFISPRRGNNATGRRAVAGMGMASVTHQVAISTATAAIVVTCGFPGSRSTKK